MFNEDVIELKKFMDDPQIVPDNKEELLRRNIAHMIMAAQMDSAYREEVEDYIASVEE